MLTSLAVPLPVASQSSARGKAFVDLDLLIDRGEAGFFFVRARLDPTNSIVSGWIMAADACTTAPQTSRACVTTSLLVSDDTSAYIARPLRCPHGLDQRTDVATLARTPIQSQHASGMAR